MRFILVASTWAALAGLVAADPPAAVPAAPPVNGAKPPQPRTLGQAVEGVLDALRANDAVALKDLAERDNPDPWLIADELIGRGEGDAAVAFAANATRRDVEGLPRFVAERRGKPLDRRAREAVVALNALLTAGDLEGAIKVLDGVQPEEDLIPRTRLLYARGVVLRATRRLAESSEAFLAAGRQAEKIGWLVRAHSAFDEAGGSAYMRSDWPAALAAWKELLSVVERRGDRADVAKALGRIGNVLREMGRYEEGLQYQERVLAISEELHDTLLIAGTLGNIASAHSALGRPRKAIELGERALKLAESAGGPNFTPVLLNNLAANYLDLGETAKGIAAYEKALRLHEQAGERALWADTLLNLASAHLDIGDIAIAIEEGEKALPILEQAGDRAGTCRALSGLGSAYRASGDYARALETHTRELKLAEEMNDPRGVARAQEGLGVVHYARGDHARARDYHERTLKVWLAVGDLKGAAQAIENIGAIEASLGDYPSAIEHFERALKLQRETGDRRGVAHSLSDLAGVHLSVGDFARAESQYELARSMLADLGDRAGVAELEGSLGLVAGAMGNGAKALRRCRTALSLEEDVGNPARVSRAMTRLGQLLSEQGDHGVALEYLARSRGLAEKLESSPLIALSLSTEAAVHRRMGDLDGARSFATRALSEAMRSGDRALAISIRMDLATAERSLGDPRAATRTARKAVEEMGSILRGLADEQSAMARSRFSGGYDVGASAAAAIGDPQEVAYFLESGRGLGLLESLGGRESLRAAVMPAELVQAEVEAHVAEGRAAFAYRTALAGGSPDAIHTRLLAFDEARERGREIVERVQREAKRAADVVYPKAADLGEIQATLRPEDALVVYGLLEDAAIALVVTRKEARIVQLGSPTLVRQACAGALPKQEPFVDPEKMDRLRDLVVRPLQLSGRTHRVLVSMHGDLSYVPVSLLFPEQETVEVSSGTTYRLFAQDRAPAGVGVLALGDPDIDAQPNAGAMALYAGGVREGGAALGRLPSAAEEARAVGDVVLVEGQASEAGLRDALAMRPRWRSVHLACHGLIDRERPTLSSLALTPSGQDDGFLTALDVFRLRIPADLVVLSACETGRGKVYRGEGLVGLTRAFMFAGASRVLCSLWKVDDRATQALMERFYQLWNPRDGAKPMGAAAALKAAQESVREQEVEVEDPASVATGQVRLVKVKPWAHPTFWAAWVLWGLPD